MLGWSGLAHSYGDGAALRYADFQLPPGHHLLLRGASGSGKSTLLALLAGLLRGQSGRLTVARTEVPTLAQAVGLCFRWLRDLGRYDDPKSAAAAEAVKKSL